MLGGGSSMGFFWWRSAFSSFCLLSLHAKSNKAYKQVFLSLSSVEKVQDTKLMCAGNTCRHNMKCVNTPSIAYIATQARYLTLCQGRCNWHLVCCFQRFNLLYVLCQCSRAWTLSWTLNVSIISCQQHWRIPKRMTKSRLFLCGGISKFLAIAHGSVNWPIFTRQIFPNYSTAHWTVSGLRTGRAWKWSSNELSRTQESLLRPRQLQESNYLQLYLHMFNINYINILLFNFNTKASLQIRTSWSLATICRQIITWSGNGENGHSCLYVDKWALRWSWRK